MMSVLSPPRIAILTILTLTAVSSVLSALALFAGHKKGFLESYDVLRVRKLLFYVGAMGSVC
jgi:hypothetical protein